MVVKKFNELKNYSKLHALSSTRQCASLELFRFCQKKRDYNKNLSLLRPDQKPRPGKPECVKVWAKLQSPKRLSCKIQTNVGKKFVSLSFW